MKTEKQTELENIDLAIAELLRIKEDNLYSLNLRIKKEEYAMAAKSALFLEELENKIQDLVIKYKEIENE